MVQENNMIEIVVNDITRLTTEAIVNAANKSLLGGGGVDGKIHFVAGYGLYEECLKLNGCKTGQAKITGGYNLPAKYVIHTVGPVYDGSKQNEKDLESCYINSLNLAKKKNIHSIAFPSISTGYYGYPPEKAAKVAIKAIEKWIENNSDYLMKIVICCYNNNTMVYYDKELRGE